MTLRLFQYTPRRSRVCEPELCKILLCNFNATSELIRFASEFLYWVASEFLFCYFFRFFFLIILKKRTKYMKKNLICYFFFFFLVWV